MTNLEAADELQYAINLIKQDGKDWLDERDIPVLEMAISALQAQDVSGTNNGGMISRQAAIEVAIKATDDWDGGYNITRANMIEKELNDLPSAQPERESIKWISHESIFGGLDERFYTCNKCGHNIGFHVENFCPNCGGKYKR